MSNLSQFIGGGTWQYQNFTTSTFFVVPVGVTVIKVLLVGGGGGGSSSYYYRGQGGGGGEIVLREVALNPLATTIYVYIGSQGAGSTAAAAGGSYYSGGDGLPTYLTYTNGGSVSTSIIKARGGWGSTAGSLGVAPGMGGGYPDSATADDTIAEIVNRTAFSSSGESSFGGIGGIAGYSTTTVSYNGGSVAGFGAGGTSYPGYGGGGGASFNDGGNGGNAAGAAGISATGYGGGGGGSYRGVGGSGAPGYARIYWVK